jgi:hypothetical protein
MRDQKMDKLGLDIYEEYVARATDDSRLTLQRNTAAAGSVTALVVITQLLQVGLTSDLLRYALITACASLPLFVAVSAVYQLHIAGGPAAYGHLGAKYVTGVLGFVHMVAGLLLLATIGLCVCHMSPRAGSIFGLASGVSGLILIGLYSSLVRYLSDTHAAERQTTADE